MTDQWQELKETIIEMRDNNGTGTQQEVCNFLANYMEILEKQMQEPCDKAVSLQAVIDLIANYDLSMGQVVRGIYALPPVNLQSKTGCWEKTTDGYSYWYRCSCCGEKILKDFWGNNYFSSYCPECGAQMTGSEK